MRQAGLRWGRGCTSNEWRFRWPQAFRRVADGPRSTTDVPLLCSRPALSKLWAAVANGVPAAAMAVHPRAAGLRGATLLTRLGQQRRTPPARESNRERLQDSTCTKTAQTDPGVAGRLIVPGGAFTGSWRDTSPMAPVPAALRWPARNARRGHVRIHWALILRNAQASGAGCRPGLRHWARSPSCCRQQLTALLC